MNIGDTVWVAAQAGRGCDYKAKIEAMTEVKARVRPLTVALSSPAWCNSVRARWVSLGMLRPVV